MTVISTTSPVAPSNVAPAPSKYAFATLAIHAGQEPDPHTGAVIPALSLSTTYKQSAVGVHQGFEYSRSGNPNRADFETAIAALEKANYALAFASGSATTATLVNMLPGGSHIVSVNDVYGGTYRYFTKVAPNSNVKATFVDLFDPTNLRNAMQDNTRMVWLETPTNPTLRLVDVRAIADIAHEFGAILVVDNTFLSPYFQNPLELGADIVVHSCTKYINGHSDVVLGVAAMRDAQIYDKLKFLQNSIGAIPAPFDCFMAHRGLKTLHLRMRQHETNALAVAEALEAASGLVENVIYPGLPSHPQYELAQRQQSGFGGMVTFRIRGDLATADRFLQNVKLFTLAESLGGVESLCELPAIMTHGAVSAEDRAVLGITDNLIRLSVGVEDTQDLVQDVLQALQAAVEANPSA
ncbi:cystathionine gamma-lyase cys3 [Dimargaris cristalligena]|uniref:cystathionine gamma-lyase n=1 Tax=Dimargaris cristalligena TaxID=215637 RepID=A0A4P9ZUH0_9FUNG|nr:cystathionine gamma-lyase cys3 [Dimargaris cristalligena]RKP36240.1 Cys/Met metabolism PLP-dependent enzyme-domain-containing protein [Dimargaris cristalligena]|eukprot:RKP36240.1 Cys/Met metabolism PLP-dependent enzyme-domain-containing protein [Dimargaris cristalligena]